MTWNLLIIAGWDVHCSVQWTLPWTKGNSLRVQEGWHGKEKRGGGVLSYSILGEGQRVWKITKEFPAALFLLSDPASFFHFSSFPEYNSVSLSAFTSPLVPFFSVSLGLTIFFLSLHISLSRFGSALFTHDVRESGSFPFWIWQWEGSWFLHRLSFSVLTKHWLFMTANSVILSASIPVFLSFSYFHTFSTFSLSDFLLVLLSFSPLSLSGAAPAVWEQIALLLLGFGGWTRPWSHLWERGRASLAYATTIC